MVRLLRYLLLAASVALICTVAGAQVESFYEQQLRAAKSDYQANRFPQAADELRIAAFGFLDRPPLLCEALVRLTVVENALGQETALTRTLERFIEAEHRFAPYAGLQIEPSIKSKFEEIVMRNVPRATLKSWPACRRPSGCLHTGQERSASRVIPSGRWRSPARPLRGGRKQM